MLTKHKVVVDRIEGNLAVILLEDRSIKLDIPLELLPQGSKEGMWLNLSFELDHTTTEGQKEKITKLIEKLKSKK